MLAALVCVPGPTSSSVAAEPVRILVVGDSISQGSAGDWTWRYRLWQHLTGHDVAFDFVGYRDDLRDEIAHTFGNYDYLEPDFDRDHAARWGMQAGSLDIPIEQLVSDHQPDVVVAQLGDNDLSAGKTPEQVRDLLADLVADARSVDPGIAMVLTTDPRPTYQPEAPAFNQLVRELVEELDAPTAPVALADAAAGYAEPEDAYDGAHPNSRGELKIAAAVADALSELGVGPPAERPLPAEPVGPRIPPVLSATAGQRGAKLSWVRSPGAETSEVWARDVTAGESDFRLVAPREGVTGTAYSVEGLTPWHTVQLRTRPFKGFWGAAPDALSNVVQVEVLGELDAVGTPALSAGSGGEVEVAWSAVPHATSYTVQWRRADRPGDWQSATVTAALSTLVTGLSSGTTYVFRVQAAHRTIRGPFSSESTLQVPARSGDPANVLLVGDSVTQGSSGDWTWRYRLWQHLQATDPTGVDLVGPRNDVWDYLEDEPGSQAYVDPGFDRDHAARWGMTLAFADAPIDDLVATYQPDVVVEMLGTNDLIFLNHTPEEVEEHIENFVAGARSADPDVDVVLSTVTQTWFAGAPELNDLLADGAAALDTPTSRVLLAAAHQDYTRSEHTFDGSHPNARGEVAIAASVADQLAGLGIGTAPQRPLPAVPLGPRIPSVLTVDEEAGQASLSWTRSPGAGTTQVQQRDVTAGGDWGVVADEEQDLSWTSGPLPLDHEVQFRVLPRKGWQLAAPDAASNVVTLTVPSLPGRPKVSVAVRGARSARVTWKRAERAETYLVELRRKGRPGWRPVAVERVRPRLVLRGLRAGVFYVRVTASNDSGAGPTSDRVRFRLP